MSGKQKKTAPGKSEYESENTSICYNLGKNTLWGQALKVTDFQGAIKDQKLWALYLQKDLKPRKV